MKKLCWLFFAFAGVLSSLMAQTPAHFDLNVQVKDLGIPTPFGNSGDDDPKRDVKLDLEVTIMQGNTAVYKETHKSVWTNYDGYLSIKVGKGSPTQSSWRDIDWNGATKTIILKGRQHDQPNAAYRVLHRGSLELPTAAYAQTVKPYERPGIGSITLFSDQTHPNIKLLANDPANNWPYLDFASNASGEDQDFVARLHTMADRKLYFFTRAGEFVFRKWPEESQVDVQTGNNAGINLKGGEPQIGFYRSAGANNFNGRILLRDAFVFESTGQDMAFDAGRNAIAYNAGEYRFDGGAIIARGHKTHLTAIAYNFLTYHNGIGAANNVDGRNGVPIDAAGNLGGTRGPATEKPPYSIYADDRILANEFDAYSDARIKKVDSYSGGKQNLEAINRLKVANFHYKDVLQMGTKAKAGFIAQEVERVLPEAVSKTTDVIPDIFQIGKNVIYDQSTKTLGVTVDSLSSLRVGEKVRLLGEQPHLVEVVAVNGTSFKIKDWPETNTKEVFVYGREVNDFRTLDYDQIFTLNVSATQALSKEVEEMRTQVTALKQVNASLQSENQTLKEELRKVNSRIDAVAKMLENKSKSAAFSSTGTN